jgi:hypothetical protein
MLVVVMLNQNCKDWNMRQLTHQSRQSETQVVKIFFATLMPEQRNEECELLTVNL